MRLGHLVGFAVTCACTQVTGLWQPVDEVPAAGAAGVGGSLGNQVGGGGAQASAGAGGTSASGGQGGSGPSEPIELAVAVDMTRRHQTLEGFGASVAWYGDWLTEHPNSAELYDIVFSELGLDILRLRNVYRDDPNDFDLTAATLVREATRSLGRRPLVLMSSWSPPARLKANDDTECIGEATCTLRLADGSFPYTDFADYWHDSLVAYAALGVPVDLVSIQNEPDFIPPSWEGCRFDPIEGQYPSYATALSAVRRRLAEGGLDVRLLGPEVVGLNGGKLATYTASMSAADLDVVAHHLYDGISWKLPNSFIPRMREAAQLIPGKPIFQTEFSVPGGGGAFEIAWLMHNSLVEQGAAAYLHWDLIWMGQDGLVSLENPERRDEWSTERGYTIREDYYSVQHYARFTDPGDVRVSATAPSEALEAAAFLAPDEARLTVTLLNTGKDTYDVRVAAPGFSASSRDVYRTSTDERFQPLGSLGAGESFAMPPRSLVTVVLTR